MAGGKLVKVYSGTAQRVDAKCEEELKIPKLSIPEKTLYIVESGRYSDRYILGVYNDLETAEIESQKIDDDMNISEYRLNTKLNYPPRKGCETYYFTCSKHTTWSRFHAEKDCSECREVCYKVEKK